MVETEDSEPLFTDVESAIDEASFLATFCQQAYALWFDGLYYRASPASNISRPRILEIFQP